MEKELILKLKEMHPGVADMDAAYEFYCEYDGKIFEDCKGAEFYLYCTDKDIKINGNKVIVPYFVRQEGRSITVYAELNDFINKIGEREEAKAEYQLQFKTFFNNEPSFFDDFETLNTNLWSDCKFGTLDNCEQPGYIENSDLVYKMTLEKPSHYLSTSHSFSQTYGSFSARIKFPEYSNTPNSANCAFWLCSNVTQSDKIMWNRNPESDKEFGSDHAGEIDIIEYSPIFGDYGTCALHYNGWGPYLKSTGCGGLYMHRIREGYHVISLVWEPNALYWYYDGDLTRVYRGDGIIGAGKEPGGDMVIILQCNIEQGEKVNGRNTQTWYGRGLDADLPQEMRVDWVKVHSIKGI